MEQPIKRSRVRLQGVAAGVVQRLALHGDRLALLADDGPHILADFEGDSPRVVSAPRPGWHVGTASFSPTNRYVLLGDAEGRHVSVYDVTRDALCAEFGGAESKPHTVFGALSSVEGREILLLSRRWEEIEAYYLDDMSRAFLATCPAPEAFIFSRLLPLNPDGDTFFALGHRVHDTLDELLTLSFKELVADGGAAARELSESRRINDHAYRIAAGPCGAEQAVFFRDPEDYEAPSEDDDEEDEESGDVWNFRGLYVRRLSDGSLVERLEYDAPIKTGAHIFATGQFYVVGCPDRVELVPRAGVAGEAVSLPGRGLSLDPTHRRLAMLDEAGDVELIEVP